MYSVLSVAVLVPWPTLSKVEGIFILPAGGAGPVLLAETVTGGLVGLGGSRDQRTACRAWLSIRPLTRFEPPAAVQSRLVRT